MGTTNLFQPNYYYNSVEILLKHTFGPFSAITVLSDFRFLRHIFLILNEWKTRLSLIFRNVLLKGVLFCLPCRLDSFSTVVKYSKDNIPVVFTVHIS